MLQDLHGSKLAAFEARLANAGAPALSEIRRRTGKRVARIFSFGAPTRSWTAITVRVTLPRMTIILILAIALLVGTAVQSRWVLLLPIGIGAFTALAIAATGDGLGDTPIPFLVILCTLVMIGGQGLRSRNVSPMS
jgi:hypothetical protein